MEPERGGGACGAWRLTGSSRNGSAARAITPGWCGAVYTTERVQVAEHLLRLAELDALTQ